MPRHRGWVPISDDLLLMLLHGLRKNSGTSPSTPALKLRRYLATRERHRLEYLLGTERGLAIGLLAGLPAVERDFVFITRRTVLLSHRDSTATSSLFPQQQPSTRVRRRCGKVYNSLADTCWPWAGLHELIAWKS